MKQYKKADTQYRKADTQTWPWGRKVKAKVMDKFQLDLTYRTRASSNKPSYVSYVINIKLI